MKCSKWVLVAFPSGYSQPLTYACPNNVSIQLGAWVWVPLQKRVVWGIVIGFQPEPDFETRFVDLPSDSFVFPSAYLDFLGWVSKYYYGGWNRVLDVSLPTHWPKWHTKENTMWIPNAPLLADTLTELQKTVVAKMTKNKSYLLYGVTGSGKSRVYLELALECLAVGKNVLLLVPEIGLTSQLADYFQKHLDVEVHLWHSNLSDTAKKRTFRSLLRKEVKVLLGTRSALLAPLQDTGLIVVDEEHDASYKQEDPSPRYSARDAAIYRGAAESIKVVLGSATPSLESYTLSEKGKVERVELLERVATKAMPKIIAVDMIEQRKLQGDKLLSNVLREKIRGSLANNEQVILLYNRRGYATTRHCLSCGEVSKCPDCDLPLVYHKKKNVLLSHFSSRVFPVDTPCFSCYAKEFHFDGSAIEKVEEELERWIPEAKVLRLDKDTTSKKGEVSLKLQRFRSEEYNVLLGTQMVAKGHDFPKVNLVGVISADQNSEDFRSGEKLFQLLTQVSGRAGRHSASGEVVLQSYNPKSTLIQMVQKQDYLSFYNWELKNRKALAFPPFNRLCLVEGNSSNPANLWKDMKMVALALRKSENVSIMGPTEAPIPRLRKQYRLRLLLKSNSPAAIAKALKVLENFPKMRFVVDVDVQNL